LKMTRQFIQAHDRRVADGIEQIFIFHRDLPALYVA
jgi:hypothetical protein